MPIQKSLERGFSMKLVNGFELMGYAQKKHYVLPAFNTTNLEMCHAIVKGLSAAGLPGYVQISSNNLRLSSPQVIANIVQSAAKDSETPIGLHLDHGKSFEDVKRCIDAGFTSIMIDYSSLPYEENIRKTREVAEYCHFYHLPLEAELGSLQGKEDDVFSEESLKTDPDAVLEFVARTNCDMLAVSVGNVHGLNLVPHIDLDLLEHIHSVSPIPLVLHGGSGIPSDVIRDARTHGLIKINYGSVLRREYIRTFGDAYAKNNDCCNLIDLSLAAVDNVSNVVSDLVKMINS